MVADEGALRQMRGHPINVQCFDVQARPVNTRDPETKGARVMAVANRKAKTTVVKRKTGPMRWYRTARSETTFAEDYCFMMGNWKMSGSSDILGTVLKGTPQPDGGEATRRNQTAQK